MKGGTVSNTIVNLDARRRRNLMIVITIQLVAILALAALIFTQVLLDDEPYPCTPTTEQPSDIDL